MKVYISADIEGITGICHWDDATVGKWNYETCRQQMQEEVVAACEGAIAAGATEILVKDAHDTGRNLSPHHLPPPVELIRGWSGHPYCMVQDLDRSFDALILVGYHSRAGSAANPLAHTYTTEVTQICINHQPIAEFHLVTWTAAYEGVPTIFVAGDGDLCAAVTAYDPQIETVATLKGRGESTRSIHTRLATQQIRAGVERALDKRQHLQITAQPLPDWFVLEVTYKHPPRAYRKSFYPSASLVGEQTVRLETRDWFEVLRALEFIVLG
ncbi:MAG: M55 family metallopeptidase [Cyanobacteriota bacterium]|nr:M55 family metallopeptidase [Cyanobacteriota bacterium]